MGSSISVVIKVQNKIVVFFFRYILTAFIQGHPSFKQQ